MNEKLIQKLYQESLARRNTEWGENIKFFDYRQFAKLIVDECVDVFKDTNSVDEIERKIKNHFGIEE